MSVSLGIIGASGTAYKRTLPALRASTLCKVTAIQCRNLELGKNIAKEFNIPEVYRSIEEMLGNGSFEVAYIATPPFKHQEDVTLAAGHRKHIICEKPLACSYGEGLKIAEIINKHTVKFVLAHHLRHQPAIKAIHNLIDSKKIGKVLNVKMQWGYKVNQSAKNAKWKLDKELSGGGSLMDVGSHCIDMALELFGVPTSVYARFLNVSSSSVEDHAIAILHYDATEVTINSSFSMPSAGNNLVIQGTDGFIECRNFFCEKATQKINLFTNNENCETINLPEVNLYKEEVEDFVRTVVSETNTAKTSIEDALNIMRVIKSAELSACRGQSVNIDEI